MNIALIGAPGSGKGTQAAMLTQHYKVERISLGDILREEAENRTSLGEVVKKYMQKGVLAPDNIIQEVIGKKIDTNGFILDGFPRTIRQAQMLKKILDQKGTNLNKAIYLKVNQEVAVSRLSGRQICPKCSKLYHVVNMPPRIKGICDNCGSLLVVREDDKEDTVRKRWEVFMNQTHSVVDYYLKENKLLEIDASQDKDKVFKEITKILG